LNYFFGGIFSTDICNEDPVNQPASQAKKLVHIKKPGALQTAIKIGAASINKRHPDYPALKVLNVILGGYFGSRLMKNIREEKGLTYGISSNVFSFNLSGYKFISTEVSKKNTQNTIDEIFKEIVNLQTKPVEKEELSIAKNYMLGEMVRMFDGPFAIAESFRSAWEFGLDNSYYYRLADKIKSIGPDEITSIAATYYKLDELYVITAG
jgi:predicted Zn-dependent peptidase